MLAADAFERIAKAAPGVKLGAEEFSVYLTRHGHDPSGLDDDALIELYVACGCSVGDGAAIAAFETKYLSAVTGALAHMKLGPEKVDEVRQQVRQKLLVREKDAPPKLDAYAGKGKLRGLVAVVATRAALSMLRKDKGHKKSSDGLEELRAVDADPELAFLKATYRAAFKRAFEQALGTLSSRDRNFLRLHHFGGLTVEQVGEVYGVHRATATRWLAKIRTTLMAHTRKALGAELQIPRGELDSVMALIQSRLEVSVQRLLSDEPDGEDDASHATSAPA